MFARLIGIAALLGATIGAFQAQAGPSDYPAASLTPLSAPGWNDTPKQLDETAPPDEAQGGITEAGTPISKRVEECFPAEQRDVFADVDQVAGPDGTLHRLNYMHGDSVPAHARNAIRGKNTWILWGEGNEVFWDWVTQYGYGLADFLVLLDSRVREKGERFARTGLVNQPGMKGQGSRKILGLYLDEADGSNILLKQPSTDIDAATKALAVRPVIPPSHAGRALFEPGDRKLYEDTLKQLADDGLDPTIYGYASGIVGLRLFPNPNFFGNTDAAAEARSRWMERVVNAKDDAYYT